MMSSCNIIIITAIVMMILMYMQIRTENMYLPSTVPTYIPSNPKEELIQYFATNWAKIASVIFKKDCDDENIPQDFLDEFKNKFGHYFKNKYAESDPLLSHYINGTYERTFKMEFKEMCTTLKKLGDYINKYPVNKKDIDLKTLAKKLEILHTEHFPQAVFISVILERMIEVCNEYPNYNINQIANTHDQLTMSIIFYLFMPSQYW
jgi:hypothetical protein